MGGPRRSKSEPHRIIFQNKQAPGDIMMLTAAVRDLHRKYPGEFITAVDTTAPEVWENNPYISKLDRRKTPGLSLGYPLIHKSNQTELHFIQGFIEDLNKKMNLKVRLTEFRPDIHWSQDELENPLIDGDYWLILSGGKADFTTKWWDVTRYQEVVNKLQDTIKFVQIGNKPSGGGARHYHPPLNNVINLVGKTSLREAMRLVLHCRGIVTPVTCFMHLAAACAKPAVVIAGGREHYTWEAYNTETLKRNMAYASGMITNPPGKKQVWSSWSEENDKGFVKHDFTPHNFLHTIGALNCCKSGGCWMTHVVESKPEKNCKDVVRRPARPPLPKCLDVITADMVVNAVLEYENAYKKGTNMPLKVYVRGANKPPVEQISNPVLDPPIAKTKVVTKKTNKKKNKKEKNPMIITESNRVPISDLKFKHLTFPITVCALTYGNNGSLAIRCLESLYNTLDPSLFRLRFGFNDPSDDCYNRVISYLNEKGNVDALYKASPQVYKYPMMRKMFWDKENPINTKWVMWLDDDSHVVDPNWIKVVGDYVDEMHLNQNELAPKGYHCFGKVYYWHFRGNQVNDTIPNRGPDEKGWVEQADWYTGREYALDRSKIPPMPKSDFATGGWWLITKEAIEACNWPDERIKHRGGDIMLGAALWQQGMGVAQVAGPSPAANSGKKRKKWFEMVKVSDARQRGYNEDIAGINK